MCYDLQNRPNMSKTANLKGEIKEGDMFEGVFKAVSQRSDSENMMVFISKRDEHDNLLVEQLFEVVSLRHAASGK
jgi:hypothetical protein